MAIDDFGQSPTIHDVAPVEPGPNDVVIRVRAAGVNPLDFKVAGGMPKAFGAPFAFPLTLGFDASGVVERVGQAVTRFRPGQEVFGLYWPETYEHGTFAEFLTISEDAAFVTKPKGLSFEEAAALPMPGGAAIAALDWLGLSAPQTLVIVGADGGVGSLATQLASRAGLKVVATASPKTADRMRAFGATDIIDYSDTNASSYLKRRYPRGVDAVLDLVSDESTLTEISLSVRSGGRVASTIFGADSAALEQRGVAGHNLFYRAELAHLVRLGEAAADRSLQVPVGSVLPLEEVRPPGPGEKIVLAL